VRLVTYENGAAVRCGALIGDAIAPLPHESVRRILEQGAVDLDPAGAGRLREVPQLARGRRRCDRAAGGEPGVDYEAELALVIGRACRNVDAGEALDCVAGVMAFNDMSARDLQMQTGQWTMGKAIDTFAPCGPALVLMDEVDDVQALRVEARVNGETVQSGTTASMIFTLAEIIAFISSVMTLEPGDIIATGTPAGVGFTRTPRLLISPDDLVEVEIENVGVLANPVVEHAALRR
jgi:2-keto-4-pentenoate hydratase/2-oxohepta-3-ene-1,7-dioic acid hydratase in catechol pathway